MKSASHALRFARRHARPALALGVAAASLLLLPTARADYGDYDDPGYEESASYSYLREIDGSAAITQSGSGTREEASINQPILAGDRLYVSRDSRAEVVLSDRNLLRLDGDSEVVFEDFAASPDQAAERTRLRLLAGAVQIVVDEGWLGSELPRIDTDNSTIYLQEAGAYLVRADRSGWSELVVRSGRAEVLTPRGSVLVQDGELATVEGDESARARVERAPQLSALERWGRSLDEEARQADLDDVDDSLHYSASRLDRYGSWVEVEHRRAWRPSVAADWRPYTYGSWDYTPSGYTWVSSEPWGWVPYHYGTWDYAHGHGWVWYPGRVYSPAWVYWYWSPSYVGWCPVGYYTNHYSSRYRHGFRFGVYGWAGGDWGVFADWNFLPTHRLRDHHGQARWVRPSYALRRELGGRELERGLITTDTRGVTPAVLEKPAEVVRVLGTRPGRGGAELPDVTPFVARRELSPDVARQVIATKPADRGALTPLRPVAVAGGEKPQLDRRPAVRPAPGATGETPRLGRKPASDWREEGGKPAPGATVDRRPAARPVEAKPAEGRSQEGVRLERRPAARPAEGWREEGAKPAESTPQSGVRLERRPARPTVLPRGEEPKGESGGGTARAQMPAVRPAEVRPREVERRPPVSRPEQARPQPTYKPESRGQDVGVRSSQPRPSVAAPVPHRAPAPSARPQHAAPRQAPAARPAPPPRSAPAPSAEPKKEDRGGSEKRKAARGRPPG